MQYRSLTPDRLAGELAVAIDRRSEPRTRIGFDGPVEIGAADLADEVAERLRERGRPVIRAGTAWWWRPASLRLEWGHTDVDMLLSGWVDQRALRRELLDPVAAGPPARYLTRLRDPNTDRAVRQAAEPVAPGSVVLLDGPFLLTDPAGLDAVVHLQVSAGTLRRVLPPARQWWVEAFARYRQDQAPADRAAAVIAFDHPAAPAIAWPDGPA